MLRFEPPYSVTLPELTMAGLFPGDSVPPDATFTGALVEKVPPSVAPLETLIGFADVSVAFRLSTPLITLVAPLTVTGDEIVRTLLPAVPVNCTPRLNNVPASVGNSSPGVTDDVPRYATFTLVQFGMVASVPAA